MFVPKASIVATTDTRGRFLTKNDLQKASTYLQRAAASLEAARLLTEKQELLGQELTQSINEQFPDVARLFGNEEFPILDVRLYTKIISYCLVVGGTGPADDYLLSNLKEVEKDVSSLSFSFDRCIEAIKFVLNYIKSNHGSGQAAEETNKYVDHVMDALS
jgi:phycocyanin alpha chain